MHVTPVDYLKLEPWPRAGHSTPISIASSDAIDILAPRLGPSATLLLHRCARRFTDDECTEWITYAALGGEFGLGVRQLVNTIERLISFGYARWADTTCTVLLVATTIKQPPPAPNVVTFPTTDWPLDVA